MTKLIPTGSKVVVQPLAGDNEKVGSIHIPEAHRDRQSMDAVVVAVGPRAEVPVVVGDRVVTPRYGGTEVDVGGRRFKLIEAKELLAVVE